MYNLQFDLNIFPFPFSYDKSTALIMFANNSTLFHGVTCGQKKHVRTQRLNFYTALDHLFDSDSSRSESEALDKIRPAENPQFSQFKSKLMEFVFKQASSMYDLYFRINAYLYKTQDNAYPLLICICIRSWHFSQLNLTAWTFQLIKKINHCHVIFCWFV